MAAGWWPESTGSRKVNGGFQTMRWYHLCVQHVSFRAHLHLLLFQKHNKVDWHALYYTAELSLLGRLDHPNIISLLGCCSDEQEKLLVYEYMQNGSFVRFLFTIIAEPLLWRRRLNIMVGVACGLTYLHSSKDQVIHCDLKNSSIFLDQDVNAKLGGLGLARSGPEIKKTHVSTCVMVTCGYAAPKYIYVGRLQKPFSFLRMLTERSFECEE